MFVANLVAVLVTLICFGGSIFFHELGHFLAAKYCGLWVPKFSIGFGPKLFSFSSKGTEFQISLLPFGGYVAIPQLSKMELFEGSHGPCPGDSTTPMPLGIKVLVSVMGVVFNLILAFVLACLLFILGRPALPAQQTRIIGAIPETILVANEVLSNPLRSVGLQPGDEILAVDSRKIRNLADLASQVAFGTMKNDRSEAVCRLTIRRGEEIFDLTVPVFYRGERSRRNRPMRTIVIVPQSPTVVAGLLPNFPGERSGLRSGDEILTANGIRLHSPEMLAQYVTTADGPLRLTVDRAGAIETVSISPISRQVREAFIEGKFGGRPVYFQLDGDRISRFHGPVSLERLGRSELLSVLSDLKFHGAEFQKQLGIQFRPAELSIHENPFRQLGSAIGSTVQTISSLVNCHSDIGVGNLMGVPGIMRVLHHFSRTDLRQLLWFLMVLNVGLAILNLLPLPGLDGGQILFAMVERRISNGRILRALAIFQNLVLLLLFALMLYVALLDIGRWRSDRKSAAEREAIRMFCYPQQ